MHEISLVAEKLFSIGGFPVTNTLLMTWLVMITLVILSVASVRNLTMVPSRLQSAIETVVEVILNLFTSVFESREKALRFFPFLATLFIFIASANWFGIAPLLPAIGMRHIIDDHEIFVPLFRSSASDLNFTVALALISLTAVQWFGIATLGMVRQMKKYLNIRSPIGLFIGILELFSEVSKTISFSFRLFGNIFAGEVLLIIVSFLMPYAGPIPFLFLEIFVGFIQALVFTMLTAIFIKIAMEDHDVASHVAPSGHAPITDRGLHHIRKKDMMTV